MLATRKPEPIMPKPKPDKKPAPKQAAEHVHDLVLVGLWIDAARIVEDQFGLLDKSLMVAPESPFRSAVWGMFESYTKTLAEVIGDKEGWLEWFAWECDFGRSAMAMRFGDGEELFVVGASDLLAAIQTDKKGRRVWR